MTAEYSDVAFCDNMQDVRLGGLSVTRLLTEHAVAGSTPGNDLLQVVYAGPD